MANDATVLETSKGLSGLLKMFKSTMTSAGMKYNSKIVFVGCAGTCVPFIELFAYTIRQTETNQLRSGMVLVPDGVLDNARSLWYVDEIGMQVGGVADPQGADYVVLLGGISMPGSKMSIDNTNEVLKNILKPDGKVIGVCFMDMFAKAGWYGKVRFDLVIDATIDTVSLKKIE